MVRPETTTSSATTTGRAIATVSPRLDHRGWTCTPPMSDSAVNAPAEPSLGRFVKYPVSDLSSPVSSTRATHRPPTAPGARTAAFPLRLRTARNAVLLQSLAASRARTFTSGQR